MEPLIKSRPWYKKKRYILPIATVAIFTFAAATSSTSTSVAPTSYQSAALVQSLPPSQNDQLSNNNYYTNVSGKSVHSPAYTTSGDIPTGASAECNDGTYSFSQHRSGTCSHHGGVEEWL